MGMRCIQCGTDNSLKDRTDHAGRCKSCNHPFAFEPSTVINKKLAFTDPFFQTAIADISTDNILFFTPKQFLYFLDRRLKSKVRYSTTPLASFFAYSFFGIFIVVIFGGIIGSLLNNALLGRWIVLLFYSLVWINRFFQASQSPERDAQDRRQNAKNLQILGVLFLLIGIPWSIISDSVIRFFIVALAGLSVYWLGILQMLRQRRIVDVLLVSDTQNRDWLERWQQVNGSLEKLLPPPQVTALPVSINSEVSNYSFDRVIVCEEDAIAQFLIANNVHFENNCAILSITGYPQNIFATVMTMLRRNPDLKVYTLHNASAVGVGLVHQLQTNTDWFANQSVVFFDLGVSPRQIFASRGMVVQKSVTLAQTARQLPEAVRQSLATAELQWLEDGRFVELESFSPQRLLRVVNQGIAQSDNPRGNDNLVLVEEGSTYGSGVFIADSFG